MERHTTSLSKRDRVMVETLEQRLLLSAYVEEPLADLVATSTAEPPAGYVYEYDAPVGGTGTTTLLDGVPEYFWYRGCGPTSVGMILGYWDTLGYSNFFPGDATTQTAAVDAGIASAGHDIDWKPTPDGPAPYHTDDSIADFFHTSRSPLPYGWSYLDDADNAFDEYGDFVGYTSGDAWNESWSSFSWADLTGEIDAGRPMMFLVDSDGNGGTDHFIPIIGYRTDPGYQYAAYTTWSNDSGVHWFDWGGMSAGDPWGIAAATYFHPSSSLPDLVSSGTRVWPPSMTWGQNFTYFYNINNYGSVAAGGSRIRFYMSTNSTISSADYELGSLYISSLAAAGELGGGVPLSLPGTPPAGFTDTDDVYIGMVVDADGAVSEGVENNNSNRGDGIDLTPVHISGQPDLIGTAFDLDVHMLNVGSVKADFTVQNVGGSSTGAFYVRFYLSSNSLVSTGDTYLGQWYISSLGAGASYSNTITLSPGTADPFGGDGTYTIGMVVDYSNIVPEGVESNNSNRGFGLDKVEANYGTKIFYADFEHGDGAMDVINDTAWAPEDGLWHLTTTRGTNAGHSGTHSMHYGRWDKVNSEWDYDIGDSAGVFYSKRIELPNEPSALSFNYFCSVDSLVSGDDIRAQVYDPDTGVYTTVLSKNNGIDYTTGGVWKQAQVDLSAFAGRNVRLRFIFNTEGVTDNNHEGWYVDDITVWAVNNPTTVEGFRSLNYASDYYHEASYVDWAADHDTFVFNEEQNNGTFVISTVNEGSAVNPAVAVYDYTTGEMLYMDSSSGTGDEASITLANSGYWNSYLVEVWDEEEDSIGEVDVHIDGTSVYGNTTITLDGNGDGSVTGTIDNDEDTDYFRVVAPPQAAGELDITLTETSGTVRTRLQIWRGNGDDSPEVIAYTENGAETGHFTGVQPGEVFYISVSDHDFNGTGDFVVRANFTMSLPATLATAEGYAWFHGPSGISNDTQSFNASIGANDTDSYYFAGDTAWTGDYTITVNRLGGDIDPVVAVYDAATGAQLGFNRDYGDNTTAQLTLNLTGLHKYIVAVADATRTGAGDVELLIQASGSSAGMAIALDANGDGTLAGQAISTNDTDFFRLTAPADTTGRLDIVVTPDALLDAAIALFDASGNQIAYAISQAVGVAETISVNGLTPGETYSLSVLSANYATTGSASIHINFAQVVPETYPGGYDYWTVADVHGDWSGQFYLATADDWDGWLFASDLPDREAVFSVTGSGMAPVLGLYNADTGARVAYDPNNGYAASASFTVTIAAHQRYYLLATDRNGSTGNVTLSMDIDDMTTSNVPIDDSGHGLVAGTITVPQDTNYFMFTAPATAAYGDLVILMDKVSPDLKGSLVLWDDTAGVFVRSAGTNTAGQSFALSISSAQAGHVYGLAVNSMAYAGGSGGYYLDFDFSTRKPGDADLDGDVDLDDFVILKKYFSTTPVGWAQGDFDGDGNVDLDDFVILKKNFATGIDNGVAAAAPVNMSDLATVQEVDIRPRRRGVRWRREPQMRQPSGIAAVPVDILRLLLPMPPSAV